MKQSIIFVSMANFALAIMLACGCQQLPQSPFESRSEENRTPPVSVSSDLPIQTISQTETNDVTEPPEADAKLQKKKKPRRSLEDMLLFQPAKHPVGDWQPRGLTFEDVWMTSADGTKIHGWYCPAANPRATVLYAHGNAGNLSHRADRIKRLVTQHNLTVLIFDYRGYGRSEGVPTVAGAIQDGKAARTYLAKRAGIKESEIVIIGRSLGGAVAVQLAADESPRGLILDCTFSSLREIGGHHFPLLAWVVPKSKLNSVAKIADVKSPLLMSHGDRDQTVPYKFGKKLYAAANEPKTWFDDAGGTHNSPTTNEYYREFDRFIDRLQ